MDWPNREGVACHSRTTTRVLTLEDNGQQLYAQNTSSSALASIIDRFFSCWQSAMTASTSLVFGR
jgi:flagellar hook-associated protein FlgK